MGGDRLPWIFLPIDVMFMLLAPSFKRKQRLCRRRDYHLPLLTVSILRCISSFSFRLSPLPILSPSKFIRPTCHEYRWSNAQQFTRVFSLFPDECGSPSTHNGDESDNDIGKRQRRVFVVGKIIISNYGDPTNRLNSDNDSPRSIETDAKVVIGGGGPQAAWGAAAALAVRDHYLSSFGDDTSSMREKLTEKKSFSSQPPPKQPVTFIAPVGLLNWTPTNAAALENILLPVVDKPPVLIPSSDHITPMINIWHDDQERVHWNPIDGSFEDIGADGLWRNRPNASDVLAAIRNHVHNKPWDGDENNIVLHCILESGKKPTGGGEDSFFLEDFQVLSKVSTLGIEPVVFPDEDTQRVSSENGSSVIALLSKIEKLFRGTCHVEDKYFMVVPDRACFDAAFVNDNFGNEKTTDHPSTEIIVRDGSSGSFLLHSHQLIPSATLCTPNNSPLNPTGAGNAYSAAYVACRGTGSSPLDAAVLATAVGAVVCEYEHLPDWSWDVLQRVAAAVREVKSKISEPVI